MRSSKIYGTRHLLVTYINGQSRSTAICNHKQTANTFFLHLFTTFVAKNFAFRGRNRGRQCYLMKTFQIHSIPYRRNNNKCSSTVITRSFLGIKNKQRLNLR